jgi:hypothetical protein
MKLEPPVSPGHCLGMLNANMRTDMLRSVHQGIEARKDQRSQRSPLEILIASIEDVLATVDGQHLLVAVGPNPFNTEPGYRFQGESDFHYDVKLLKSQLRALRKIVASLGR